MSQPVTTTDIERPSIEDLRKFASLSLLSEQQLYEVAKKAEVHHAKKHEVLINIGENHANSFFLLKGNVLLEAEDGRQNIIKHTDESAKQPLSRLQPSRFRVTTLTPITYISINNDFLDKLLSQESSSPSSSHYIVEESSEENLAFSTQVIAHIYEDLHHGQLRIHSWQPPMLEIARAIIAEQRNTQAIAQWLLHDPVLTLKVLKAHQTHLKPTPAMTTNLTEVIEQLSTDTIHKLVFMLLFRESRHPHTTLMVDLFSQSWETSISVSQVARQLAQETQLCPPDLAALGGLLHNISEAVIISYAYDHAEYEANHQEIIDCIETYGADLNRLLLIHWKVSEMLAKATANASRLQFSHVDRDPQHALTDAIIAARAIVNSSLPHGRPQPPLPQIPAIQRLQLTQSKNIDQLKRLQALASESVRQARQKLRLS